MMFKRIFKIALFSFAVFISVLSGAISATDRYISIFDIEGEPPANLDAPLPELINCLLIGSDKVGTNTDALMLASFNREEKKLRLMSIPRDTRVLVKGSPLKINACLAWGREELLLETVKDITGAPVHYYIKVDVSRFKDIVDILGGVDFDVPRDMKYQDPSQNLKIDLKKGFQHLDGSKAEQLVRYRRYVTGDIERAQVQRDFMQALIKQNLNPDLIAKAPKLFIEISKHIKTNIKGSDIMHNLGMISLLANMKEDVTESYVLPGEAMYIGNISYFVFDLEKSLSFCKENFGGSGSSPMKEKYLSEYAKTRRNN